MTFKSQPRSCGDLVAVAGRLRDAGVMAGEEVRALLGSPNGEPAG